MWIKLSKQEYLCPQIVNFAQSLIGAKISFQHEQETKSYIIFETEAYAGIHDRASHAYGGKRTKRNESMYAEGGQLYIYTCYGIHSMINIVSNEKNIPDAVLIRGMLPIVNNQITINEYAAWNGPGKISKKAHIEKSWNGVSYQTDLFRIEKHSQFNFQSFINISSRIGIAYALEDAYLPYRFFMSKNHLKIAIHEFTKNYSWK
jgi:DNA-3-methyladenine glycosylase